MRTTIAEIARRVELSQATVSRVLNGKGRPFISDATRDRVLKAAEELGYQPNLLARGLVTGRTHVVALWIRNPDRPYYSRILRNMQELAGQGGYEMILTGFRDQGVSESISPPPTAGWPVDAIIAADCGQQIARYRESQSGRPTAIVSIGSDYPEDGDYVGFDVECGVRQAVQHLVDVGCKRIAHLSGGCSIERVRIGRAAAYENTLRAAGLDPIVIFAADERRATARRAVVDHIRANGAPDGLFCLNDDMAIGAYRGLRDLNLRVPQDVALVGCDGIEDVEYLDTPLSTIVQPVEEMCRHAWDAVSARLEQSDGPPRQIVLKPSLLIRESTLRTG